MDVVYDGIRLTPSRSSSAPRRASIASACRSCRARIWRWRLRWSTDSDGRDWAIFPSWSAAFIPNADGETLRAKGVAAVYTPKDFRINRLIGDIVKLVDSQTPDAGRQSGRRRRR